MHAAHPKLGDEILHGLGGKSFGQDVGALLGCRDMLGLDDAVVQVILNVEFINIHMIHPVMIHWIMCNADGRLVVAVDNDGLDVGNPEII